MTASGFHVGGKWDLTSPQIECDKRCKKLIDLVKSCQHHFQNSPSSSSSRHLP